MELTGSESCLYANHSQYKMGPLNFLKVVSSHSENCDKVQQIMTCWNERRIEKLT